MMSQVRALKRAKREEERRQRTDNLELLRSCMERREQHFVHLLTLAGVRAPKDFFGSAYSPQCQLLSYGRAPEDDTPLAITEHIEIAMRDYVSCMRAYAHDNPAMRAVRAGVRFGKSWGDFHNVMRKDLVKAGLLPAIFTPGPLNDVEDAVDEDVMFAVAVTRLTRYGGDLLSVDEAERVADQCVTWMNAHQ